jgi:hypothetical protein
VLRAHAIRHHGESLVAANGCYLFDVSGKREIACKQRVFRESGIAAIAGSRAFAQILGKLYFLHFFENLRRILVDYGEKRRRRANGAFNAAC